MHGLLAVLSCKYYWQHADETNTNHIMYHCCCPVFPAGALSCGSSGFGSSAKDAATALNYKAKAAVRVGSSALSSTTTKVAGRSADLHSDAYTLREPAIITALDRVQDKLAGEQKSWACRVVLLEKIKRRAVLCEDFS
jgi:hypothetical protein